MATKNRFAIWTLTLLLVAPVATATWGAYGTHEPDTLEDTEDYMFFEPTTDAAKNVYFNGWAATSTSAIPGLGIVNTAGANPNVGIVSMRNEAPADEVYTAILGVWLDCNSDGYIGLAETAAREYESALLIDASVCPPSNGKPNVWNGAHNYNKWVTEFIPVGTSGGDVEDNGLNLRIYRDEDSRVWGDLARPGDHANVAGNICPVTPPRDSFASTGGILNIIDCRADLLETSNLATAAADPSNSLGLRYGNEQDARQGDHPLSFGTFGSEESSKSAAHAYDCDAPPAFRFNSTETVDSTDLEEIAGRPIGTFNDREVLVRSPAPSQGPSDATAPATLNMTNEEVRGDCDYSNDGGKDFYGNVEGDTQVISGNNKRGAQINFAFTDSSRGGVEPNGNLLGNSVFGLIHPGKAGMANDAGVGLGGDWNGNLRFAKSGPRTVRADLTQNSVGIAPAYFITYYARVGEAITQGGFGIPGGYGTYGSEACGSETSGVINGWNCDTSLWYLAADGTRIPGTETFAIPGDGYHFRDVDCHDGGNSLGIALGAPAFGASPCATP